MKLKTLLIGAISGLMVLASCEKNDNDIDKIYTEAPTITSPSDGGQYVLIPENNEGTFETFIWSKTIFSKDIVTEYALQIDKATGDFTTNVQLKESTTELWQAISTAEMNTKLQELGISPEEDAAIQLRVVAIGGDETLFSIPIAFKVNRYIYDDEVPVWNIAGTATGVDTNIPMIHDEGNDTWSLRMDLVDGAFKFVDSSIQGTVLGKDTEGTLVENGADIEVTTGNYSIVFDANAMTYTLTENILPSQLYFVGSVNGWSADAPYYIGVKDEGNGVHWGFLDLDDNSEIKILTSVGSWDGYGAGSEAGKITEGGGNIVMKDQPGYVDAGQYIVKLDVKQGTIELVKITSVAVVGDGANGGWPDDFPGVELSYDSASKAFKGDVTFNATGEWKIRINQTWTYNLGGTPDNMTFDGGNFATPGAVTNNLSVNLITTAKFNYELKE